jgi:Flp pilus assembly protein TadD
MEGKIEASANSGGVSEGSSPNRAKRKVILRDSATLLVLALATVVLYAITSFLFRSFETRRAELGKKYAARGTAALRAGQPEQAIAALRVAQSYAPDARRNHLLLAEALAEAHHTDEATDYFLSLRELEPADGFINLQLARLARQKGETRQAIDYYRASSLGNWQGDGLTRRREVQLELSDYLIQNGQMEAARAELLVAAANAPETAELDTLFGDKLLQTNDPNDALIYYQKAVKLDRHDFAALYKGGRLAYAMGDYDTADKLLTLASRDEQKASASEADEAQLTSLLQNSERIQRLTLSQNLPAEDRAEHIRTAAAIAKQRLDGCAAKFSSAGSQTNSALPGELQVLKTQWQTAANLLSRRSSLENAANQDSLTQLVFDTEKQTANLCGQPMGDDALLLLLAKSPYGAQ